MGWARLSFVGAPLDKQTRLVIESFPLSAWRSLKIAPLPAKQKTRSIELDQRLRELAAVVPFYLSGNPTHDQLQAVVAGLAGLAVEKNAWNVCVPAGVLPFEDDRHWREGLILNVTRGISEALFGFGSETLQTE